MTCNDICIAFMHKTSSRIGCECMVGVDTVFSVRQYGKSTLCLVFDVCRENQGWKYRFQRIYRYFDFTDISNISEIYR